MSNEPKIGGREPVLVELVARRDLLVAPLRPLAEPASQSQPFYPHPHPLPTRPHQGRGIACLASVAPREFRCLICC
jgi:hypothetical protein